MFLRKPYLQTAFTELRESHPYIYILFEHLPADYFSIVCSFDYRSVKEHHGEKLQVSRSYTLSEFFAALPKIDDRDEFHVKILDDTLTDNTGLTIPNLEQCYASCLYRLCEKSMLEGCLLVLTPKLIRDYGLSRSDAATVRNQLALYNHMASVKLEIDLSKNRIRRPHDDTAWERLEQIIRETHHTINSFAIHIGLPRGENLYQIKRGNNRISRDVAGRIHDLFPEYSLLWILTGIEESNKEAPVVQLPLYRDHTTMKLPQEDSPTEHLTLSAAMAADAEFALFYSDDILNPYLLNATLLMKSHQAADEILFGNIYLIEIQGRRLFRIVKMHASNPDLLCLTTLQPSTFADMVVPKSLITGLWLAVGAVCNMVR